MTVKDRIMGEANAAYLSKEESSFVTNENYSLYKSTLLDSATTIHISNDLSRFQNFKKAPRNHVVRCGNHFARILGYGSTDLHVRNERNALSVFRLRNVAYCPDFMTNLVSLVKLKKRDIHWNTEKNVLYRADNRRVICKLQEINEQQVIDHVPVDRYPEAFAANRVRQVRRKRKLTTRDPRPPRKGDGILWHRRMGHP